jgi:hypothetical protein
MQETSVALFYSHRGREVKRRFTRSTGVKVKMGSEVEVGAVSEEHQAWGYTQRETHPLYTKESAH